MFDQEKNKYIFHPLSLNCRNLLVAFQLQKVEWQPSIIIISMYTNKPGWVFSKDAISNQYIEPYLA